MDVNEPVRQGGSGAAPGSVGRAAPSRLLLRPAGVAGPLPAGFDGLLLPDAFHHDGVDGLTAGLDPVLGSPPAGVPVLVDLHVGRVASDGVAATGRPQLFPRPAPELALDPRHGFSEASNDAHLHGAGDAEAVGGYWGEVLRRLSGQGVSGARLLGLAQVPDGLRLPLLRAIRTTAPDSVLLVDTAGVPWPEIDGFAGLGLNGVMSSLCWWDGKAEWFSAELAMLRRVAPVLAAMPARAPGDADGGMRRLLGLAVADGIGWIVPAEAAVADDAVRLAAIAEQTRELGLPHLLSSPGQAVTAILRGTTDDPRTSHDATLLLLNTSGTQAASFDPASVLPWTGGAFSSFAPLAGTDDPTGHEKLVPGHVVTLPPGALCAFRADRLHDGTPLPIDEASAVRAGGWARLALEAPSPAVDGGLFPVKRTAGDTVEVEIDVIGDGHDVLSAALQWQGPGDAGWHETPMRLLGNDRWQASFPLERRGPHQYRVQAWRDVWATYRHELGAKHKAGVATALEVVEGMAHVRDAVGRGGVALGDALVGLEAADEDGRRTMLLSEELAALMAGADARPFGIHSAEIPVDAERTGAGYASWYEVFPRSMADDMGRHGTFADVERHLPRIRGMGFDVLYFPPVHPIGRLNRKGPNNTLTPGPEDVGSPYAVGTTEGGHDAIHPRLGTLDEFLHLRRAAEAQGLELALDFAIQCAPDHPWLKDHRDWFDWRPDGTVRYAENPPKKYQDIVNVDFYAADSVPGLWMALANVVLFWCEQGIRLFRVDNPHTKPFPFWQWMIGEVRARYPDAAFLAEAFTRPKVMNRLGKVGFSQSYTYFTWRNTKAELTEYLQQLTTEAPRDFFRPHFFVNTPDINPFFLQNTTRAAFLIRAAAAATLSGLWGVYNGFELCEGTPLAAGKEEYLDSEKFQIRHWDWDRAGNIVAEITRLNAIRRENPALRTHHGIGFLDAANETVLWFEKATRDRSNTILVAISLDPNHTQTSTIDIPLWKWSLPDQGALAIDDLVGGNSFVLSGRDHSITLTPDRPYLIWRAAPAS